MSVLLIGSAIVTTTMIPAAALRAGGPRRRPRARVSGASRPRRLVRHALRPRDDRHALVRGRVGAWPGCSISCRSICRATAWRRTGRARRGRSCCSSRRSACVVTVVFNADVDEQGGAYATGVLDADDVGRRRRGDRAAAPAPLLRARSRSIFVYTTVVNICEQPEGIKIAAWFIVTIVVSSLDLARACDRRRSASRASTTTSAARFIRERRRPSDPLRIIANRPNTGPADEYDAQARGRATLASSAARRSGAVPRGAAGRRVGVLRRAPTCAARTSAAIASCGARARPFRTRSPGCCSICAIAPSAIPHAYFGWTEGNPITYLLKFLAFGEGDTAPVCREVLRQAEPVPSAGREFTSARTVLFSTWHA